MKNVRILLVATVGTLLALLVGACGTLPHEAQVNIDGREYVVAIADTDEKRSKGLMNQENLRQDEGMLFLYDTPSKRSFWMKDTPLPLTAVWIKGDRVIGSTAMEPCLDRGDDCESYPSPGEVDSVLEVRTDSAPADGWKEGTRVYVRN